MRDEITFWALLEEIGWGRKTLDYKEISKYLTRNYSPSYIKLMKQEAVEKRNNLSKIMTQLAIDVNGTEGGYWNTGDDGFWDLTAHIVGLGEKMYNFICENPIYAKTIKYKENFEYSLNVYKWDRIGEEEIKKIKEA